MSDRIRLMKKCLSFLIFAFLYFSASALSLEDFSLSIEPIMGIRNGQIDEYVFLKNSRYSDDKLSELNWEIKNEFYMGFKAHSAWKSFFQELSFSFAIPKNSGQMQDSDWLNIEEANQYSYLYKTHYSESDNHLDNDFSFGIKAGYDFKIKDRFNIKPSFYFEYSNTKFTAKGGTCWYGNKKNANTYYAYYDTANRTITKLSGSVIDYKRINYFFWIGSDFSIDLSRNFSLNTGFFFAPYAYVVSYDTHIIRGYEFADLTIDYFSAFKGNLGLSYKIAQRHSISLTAGFFYLKTIRGDSFLKKSGETYYKSTNSTDGGAGAKYFDLTLSYKFKIF